MNVLMFYKNFELILIKSGFFYKFLNLLKNWAEDPVLYSTGSTVNNELFIIFNLGKPVVFLPHCTWVILTVYNYHPCMATCQLILHNGWFTSMQYDKQLDLFHNYIIICPYASLLCTLIISLLIVGLS